MSPIVGTPTGNDLAPFATHSDLADRLGIELTDAEEGRADVLLTLASDLIRRAARQSINRATSTITVESPVGRVLFPQRPVVSVDTVIQDGTNFADWILRDNYLDGSWGRTDLTVTYTHGFDPIPDAIKAICLECVVRVWVNPGNTTQESYGSERTSYAATGMILTEEERKAVRDVVRRGSQAVDLR